MIFGNPDNFAIYIDKVDSWSTNPFNEGFIWLYIQSHPFPKNGYSYVSTLDANIADLLSSPLVNPSENEKLFSMETLELCQLLIKKRYPSWAFDSEDEYNRYPDDLYEKEELLYSVDIDFLMKTQLSLFVIKYKQKIRMILVNKDSKDNNFFNLNHLKLEDILDNVFSFQDLRLIIDEMCHTYTPNLKL